MTLPMENHPQRSPGWFAARAIRATASRFKDVVSTHAAKVRYAQEIKDGMAGILKPEINAPSLDWGVVQEPAAIANYELWLFERGFDLDVVNPHFLVHPEYDFIGASCDLLVGSDGVGEIKCPFDESVHIMTLLAGAMPSSHYPQVQGEMLVACRPWCDFISFDPRQEDPLRRLFVQRVFRDDAYIDWLLASIIAFWNDYVLNEAPALVDFMDVDPDDLF